MRFDRDPDFGGDGATVRSGDDLELLLRLSRKASLNREKNDLRCLLRSAHVPAYYRNNPGMQTDGTKDSETSMTTMTSLRPRVDSGTAAALKRLRGQGLVNFLNLEQQYLDEADRLAVCSRCRDSRVKAGFEQPEFAEMLIPPVTVRTLHNYEHYRPPFKYLRQWAEITGVNYRWLLTGEEPTPEPVPAAAPSEIAQIHARLDEMADLLSRVLDALDAAQ